MSAVASPRALAVRLAERNAKRSNIRVVSQEISDIMQTTRRMIEIDQPDWHLDPLVDAMPPRPSLIEHMREFEREAVTARRESQSKKPPPRR